LRGTAVESEKLADGFDLPLAVDEVKCESMTGSNSGLESRLPYPKLQKKCWLCLNHHNLGKIL
jgi:hypothetical protein